ncbi:MAG TPA: hypothetical protein VE343_10910 [Streptosporangiaceae bacterium]|nr:hypothetical protein [Streptosporangiaceae bacterium]
MSVLSEAPGRLSPDRARSLRRANFAAFALLVVQFGIGTYVNLFVPVPSTDAGGGFGQAISAGPAALTIHIVAGLLLILAAIGVLVQSLRARRPALIATAVAGLVAMIGAAAAGSSFVDGGSDGASMTMAALTAAGLLCYGAGGYLLAPRRAEDGQHPGDTP